VTRPNVSIVLPTYNRAATLGRAVESVLTQSYSDFELIIVDDGSSDETKAVVAKYQDKRVRYVFQENGGAGVARNNGVRLARAPYVAFQDSDDEWLPDKLNAQMNILSASRGRKDVLYSDMLQIRGRGSACILGAPEVVRGRLIAPHTGDYQTFGIGIQASVIRRSKLISIGGFDNRLPRFIDLDLFSRLAYCCEFYHMGIPLVKYYESDGITRSFLALATARGYLLRKNESYFSKRPRYRAVQLVLQADALWKSGRLGEARRCCVEAIKAYPWAARIVRKCALIWWFSPELVEKLRGRRKPVSAAAPAS
jgi:glycosyltransferase involved in cell wall biosynthesis